MHTTVMFINGTQPIARTPIRLASQPGRVYTTDDQGRIELALVTGNHTFEIKLGDRWISRPVERSGESPVFIVDISRAQGEMMSTMNTLQISLASMVGDRFVFETVLGRGGMGIVVKALDRMLNRPVAIKMLSDELQDNEEAQQIFLVEARNLATLSHPNLVAIHDILNVEGRVLMVFEYVLGENVEKMIKRKGRLDQIEALRIIIQLTRVVVYLHEHDLIHRDLKPANIIIQADGTLKLIDFGLARSLTEVYIRGTRVRGTPAYMAPEQIQGISLGVGTDIYQIGITLYEMLTGDLPFTNGDLSYAHVHTPAPMVGDAINVDPELDRLVAQCLEKSVKARPLNAGQLLEHFQAIYSRLAQGIDGISEVVDLSSGNLIRSNASQPFMSDPSLAPYETAAVSKSRNTALIAAVAVLVLGSGALGLLLMLPPDDAVNEPVATVDVPVTDSKTPPPQFDSSTEVLTVATSITELGLIAAEAKSNEAGQLAQASLEPVETDQVISAPTKTTIRRVVRTNPKKTKVNAPIEEKPIEEPPVEKPVEEVPPKVEVKPKKVAEKKSEVKTLPVAKKKKNGLLSTDEESKTKKNSLLPVD